MAQLCAVLPSGRCRLFEAFELKPKISGFQKPSAANEAAFNQAIEDIAHASHHLLEDLVTQAAQRNREVEAVKARARTAQHFVT